MVDFKSLGQNVRIKRTQAKMSQEKLAEKCGCCGSYIGKIENNNSLPSLEMIAKIADVLGVTIDQLVQGSDYKPESAFMREVEERIDRLPAPVRQDICQMVSNLLDIIEGLHK